MSRPTDESLLRPGDAVSFADRDELLETLDRLARRVPARHQGRTKVDREHHCMLRYVRFLAGEDLLRLPVTLRKSGEGQDPPDFILEWPDGATESLELTDGSTEDYQRLLALASGKEEGLVLPVDINTPDREARELWAGTIFASFLKKAQVLVQGRFDLDHLLIYDLTGLQLLVPLADGASLLRERIESWEESAKPTHRFARISVLRGFSLLLDVTGDPRIVSSESPYFEIPAIRANGEQDLRARLRNIDRFCRENSIRHLKAFGSILGDQGAEPRDSDTPLFRDDSDLDMLVEFEPGARVTLLDMARMERELSELTGFKVDLRTAGDLSRYFRPKVLAEAVEIGAA